MKLQAFPSPKQEGEQIGAGGLALFAAMAAAEVCEGAPTAQARGFFAAIGRRMAVLEPLEGVSDAAVLCARINGFWQDLGWGEVELAVGDDAIVVHHRNLPKSITPDPQGHWGTMMLGLLEAPTTDGSGSWAAAPPCTRRPAGRVTSSNSGTAAER
ncbi:hypothetical protein [Novosphingobium sp. ST904]|uniref:cellulose biosynthesis protein BcsD n=1 Tax=Novosphingobium sp. ST904 TaxID=1684385 RepID=UPI000A43834B|nr:hypothetical protein [Novosphingobium sp. ST904]